MKTIKILLAAIFIASFISCDKEDEPVNNIYDNVNGQTGVGFTVAGASVVVPVAGASVTLPIQATTISSSERVYTVTVDTDLSTGVAGDYTLGTLTIPADSYNGSMDIDFVDTNLVDLVSYDLVLNLDIPAGQAVVGNETVTVTYNKYLICNDLQLDILADNWASETTWDVVDATNTVVASGGPYSNGTAGTVYTENFTLADGCYTFTIYDSYGDGLFDGANTGTYNLFCSIITHASGAGNFGGSASTDFCVNP